MHLLAVCRLVATVDTKGPAERQSRLSQMKRHADILGSSHFKGIHVEYREFNEIRDGLIADVEQLYERMETAPASLRDESQIVTLRAVRFLLAASGGAGVLIGDCYVDSSEAGLRPVITQNAGKLEWWCTHDPHHTASC